ncbi:MAG: response regulator transcription factor [Acholeplasmataceae bacterium]|nr:response regulator transcription factor [Acholeplasmataceae bacterium]
MPLVYYVEDDQAIGYIIEKTILNAGLKGVGFKQGEAFLDAFAKNRPDMVLLDIMLPDISGLELLRTIRKLDSEIPVMMVSALQNEMDKVTALDLGADDYMTKPFGVLELTSRIQSKLRKHKDRDLFSLKNVILDDSRHKFFVDESDVYLTNKEYEIMKLLISQKGLVVRKEDIFMNVWETDYIGETRTLDMHIKALRDKLLEHNSAMVIRTIRGVGYMAE